MKQIGYSGTWLASVALLSGGCGAIPDVVVDAARSSAKEALQEAVGDAVRDLVDNTVGEILDMSDFELPFANQVEDGQENGAVDDNGEDVEEEDRDTGRTGTRAFDNSIPRE